jgi:hypothetical protein
MTIKMQISHLLKKLTKSNKIKWSPSQSLTLSQSVFSSCYRSEFKNYIFNLILEGETNDGFFGNVGIYKESSHLATVPLPIGCFHNLFRMIEEIEEEKVKNELKDVIKAMEEGVKEEKEDNY